MSAPPTKKVSSAGDVRVKEEKRTSTIEKADTSRQSHDLKDEIAKEVEMDGSDRSSFYAASTSPSPAAAIPFELIPASEKRNIEFHMLFRSAPEDDPLMEGISTMYETCTDLADYSCALQKEILIQGRLYLTRNHLCFNSNIFGWVTNVSVFKRYALIVLAGDCSYRRADHRAKNDCICDSKRYSNHDTPCKSNCKVQEDHSNFCSTLLHRSCIEKWHTRR